MRKIVLYSWLYIIVFGLSGQPGVSHQSYDELLQKYVDEDGMVNYKDLREGRLELKSYLKVLEANPPQASWTDDQKLAFWINAYNAFTLELILTHYPIESIKDIGSVIKIPFVSTAWDISFINIGGKKYDLNDIEHGVIRKEFDEPRIHFALVCAAVSCPKLRSRAFTPENLESLLSKAATDFLADTERNDFKSTKEVELSRIFSWYKGDFNSNGTLIEYLNQYAPLQLEKNAKITWKDYDWALNEQ